MSTYGILSVALGSEAMARLIDVAQANAGAGEPEFPWRLLGAICVAGALGGVGNALISDNGFLFPKYDTTSAGQQILRPGVFGNILIGLIAALVFWLLNTDFDLEGVNQTARSLGGAIVAGVGGARVLTSEVDKRLLRAAASEAAGRESSPGTAGQINAASPAHALEIAKSLPQS